MSAEEKSILQKIGDGIVQYAPALGGVLAPFTGGTSAVIGTAIGALGKAFGLGENPEPEALQKAIAADPQAALKLALAEQDFTLKLKDLELQEFRAEIDSIKNAQTRQLEHEKFTGKSDINLYILAWVVVVGFFVVTGILMYVPLPKEQSNVLFMLLGTLATGFGTVLAYFFGSNKSSEEKTRLLAKAQPVE